MMPVALDIENLSARHDPVNGGWVVTADGRDYRLRPWTWGERRRMVAAASASGRLDGEVFLAGLVAALYDPAPPAEQPERFGYAALRLLDVPPDGDVAPLRMAEQTLAARFGWLPSSLDAELAADLDRLVPDLPAGAPQSPSAGDGWTRIVFDAPTESGSAP